VFYRDKSTGREYLAVYVDDLIIMTPTVESMSVSKHELLSCFKSKDLGEITYVLGIRVLRNRHKKTIQLDQPSLIERYLENFQVSSSASTPGFWKPLEDKSTATLISKSEIQSRVGALLHIGIHTCPDILLCTIKVARQLQNVNEKTTSEVNRILSYLRNTVYWMVQTYPRSELLPMLTGAEQNQTESRHQDV
jgi:hypothetical protein